jgi:hypothetical protein
LYPSSLVSAAAAANAASGKQNTPAPNYQRNLMLLTTVPTMTLL